MKPEQQIRAAYTDLLDRADTATLRAVGDLDALYTNAPVPATPPFNALLSNRARAASRFDADDSTEAAISGLVSGAPPGQRRNWFRQGFAFAGATIAFALVASLLVLLFRASDHTTRPAVQPDASPTATAKSALPATSIPDQIAFTSIRDGNPEIYVINADGAGLTRLTDNGAQDREPAWSPDGEQIAFVSDRDGENRLYVMNANGSDARLVTDEAEVTGVPVWSPDGKWIAFSAFTEGGRPDIFIVHPDGSDLRQPIDGRGGNSEPSWSPASLQIVYRTSSGDAGKDDDVFVVNIDGSGRANLTNDDIPQREPTWSPDGALIAFAHASKTVNLGQGSTAFLDTIAFYDMTSQAGDPLRTTLIEGSAPRWSPDSRHLVYRKPSTEPGPIDTTIQTLHILQADGLETGQIPGIKGAMLDYDWEPNGEALSVVLSEVNADGGVGDDRSLWVAPLDGSAPVQIAEQLERNTGAAWRPDPSHTDASRFRTDNGGADCSYN